MLAFKIKDNLERHGSIDNSETVELKSHMKLSDFQYEWIKFNVVSALLMWNKILEFFIHTVSISNEYFEGITQILLCRSALLARKKLNLY